MLGMIHELEKTGKCDHNFINKYTSGWKEFNAYVMGKTDGIEKTPAWASKVTGVPESRIKSLAHELQENRTMIMMGWGIQRIQAEDPLLLTVLLSEACLLRSNLSFLTTRPGKAAR